MMNIGGDIRSRDMGAPSMGSDGVIESRQTPTILEMRYDTWGTCGQHDVQHPMIIYEGELLTMKDALMKQFVQIDVKDHHSRKNLHYNRLFTLLIEPEAILIFRCYASSSRHRTDIEIVKTTINIKIEKIYYMDELLLYCICFGDKKYYLRTCQKGKFPEILNEEEAERYRQRVKAWWDKLHADDSG